MADFQADPNGGMKEKEQNVPETPATPETPAAPEESLQPEAPAAAPETPATPETPAQTGDEPGADDAEPPTEPEGSAE
jgi:hypothetical protein